MRRFLDCYKFGTFEIAGKKIPKVLLGTSPFMGAGQFGARGSTYYSKFYLNPENIKDVILECINLGMNAVQPFGYPRLIDPIRKAMEESSIEIFVLGSVGLRNLHEEIALMRSVNSKCIAIHAILSDKGLGHIKEKLQEIKGHGIITGIVTHNPGTVIQKAEGMEEVDLILAPVNKIGRFMDPSFDSSLEAIKNCSKPIIAIKPFAAGKLHPSDALEFLAGLVDGIVVGITSRGEAQETLAIARRFF
jgi:hypothetical protein